MTLHQGRPTRFTVPVRHEATFEFLCPRCGEMYRWASSDVPEHGTALTCPGCELDYGVRLRRPPGGSTVDRCWLCGSEDLYVRKDINTEIGLLVVLLSIAMGVLVTLLVDPMVGAVGMAIAAASELIVYGMLAECTACYVCGSIFRGFPRNPKHQSYVPAHLSTYLDRRERWISNLVPSPALRREST